MAASTWTQIPCSRAMRPISASESNAPVEVVPRVTVTKHGIRPAARSSRTRAANASGRAARLTGSAGMERRLSPPSPAIRTALSSEECDSSDP